MNECIYNNPRIFGGLIINEHLYFLTMGYLIAQRENEFKKAPINWGLFDYKSLLFFQFMGAR